MARDPEGFRWRTRSQIEEGRSWLWVERGTILFKAEASAWTPAAIQIQQVWVDTPARNKGYAQRGMRDLCRLLLERDTRQDLADVARSAVTVVVIADPKGSENPDEIVIVSGHLDSWDLGTGAIDNAAGVVVANLTANGAADVETVQAALERIQSYRHGGFPELVSAIAHPTLAARIAAHGVTWASPKPAYMVTLRSLPITA